MHPFATTQFGSKRPILLISNKVFPIESCVYLPRTLLGLTADDTTIQDAGAIRAIKKEGSKP